LPVVHKGRSVVVIRAMIAGLLFAAPSYILLFIWPA